MQEDPELKKKLSRVEEKQNRWIGRRIEAHDARETPNPTSGQAFAAVVPEEALPLEYELEQLPFGPTMGPSSQGGEEPFDTGEIVEILRQNLRCWKGASKT